MRETPVDDLAEASNTALSFVVVLDSFDTEVCAWGSWKGRESEREKEIEIDTCR